MSEQHATKSIKKIAANPIGAKGPLLQRKCACGGTRGLTGECEQCSKKRLQRKTWNSEFRTRNDSFAPPIVYEVLRSSGQPLDSSIRAFMEPRFGHDFSSVSVHPARRRADRSNVGISRPGDFEEMEADRMAQQILRREAQAPRNAASDTDAKSDFSRVRVHTDAHAARLSQALNASAFTYGNDIYFNEGRYSPTRNEGRALLAHELAHVTQQAVDRTPKLQRQLLLTGPQGSIDDFIAMCETASGLVLMRNPLTNQVTAIGSSATPATSPSFERRLTDIINDPVQNAEIHVGRDQPNVDIGAFPVPSDLTAGGVQNVDMDDINAMEGAPGIGVADLLHEISENYEAHAHVPAAGIDLFPAAHQEGLRAEEEVATDIVGSGRRVAQADQALGPGSTRIAEDYDTYYVLSTLTNPAGTRSFSRSNVSFAAKVNVTTQTIDQFGSNSDAVPPTGAPVVAAIAAVVAANPLATVRIDGFTDDRGGATAFNRDLGGRRAENAAADFVAAGVGGGRIHTEPRGAVSFVAPNDTELHRGQNRRVVITVTRPGP